jgi:hypothetical protein
MAGMIFLDRTPESIGGLAIEFTVAVAFTIVMWKAGFSIRGINRYKDGPMSKADISLVAFVVLGLFILFAVTTAEMRKQRGLPIIW